MIRRIESNEYSPLQWEPEEYQDFKPVPKKTLPFQRDSLLIKDDSSNAWTFIAPEYSPSALDLRPKLEAPQINASQITATAEELENKLIPKTSKNDEAQSDKNKAEIAFLFLYMACVQAQEESKKEHSMTKFLHVQSLQTANKVHMENYFNLKDEIISRSNTNEVLGWVNYAVWGGLAIAGVASVALTIFTGGAALPTVLIVANAALAVASGTLTITQGILEHNNDIARGDMKVIETERYLNTDKIKEGVKEFNQDYKAISDYYKEFKTLLMNGHAAAIGK